MKYVPFLGQNVQEVRASILSPPLLQWPLTPPKAEPWFSCIPKWLHEQWASLPAFLLDKNLQCLRVHEKSTYVKDTDIWDMIYHCSKSLTHPNTNPNECLASKYCFIHFCWMNEQMNVLIITDKDTLFNYLDYSFIAFPSLEINIPIFLLLYRLI